MHLFLPFYFDIFYQDISVDEEFMEVLERLSARANLHVAHGKFTRKVPVKAYVPPPPPPRDPITQMFDFKYEQGFRTLDLLMRMDRNNDMLVDRQEFVDGLLVRAILFIIVRI